jgi:hypothetical protein
MALSEDKIASIRNTVSEAPNPVEEINQGISSAVKDPFGAIISKLLTKIGSLSIGVENKINDLAKEVVKSVDTKGRVSLEGNNIVITVSPQDATEASKIKNNITTRINTIKNSLVILETTLKSLNALQTAISTLQTALTVQETILNANPTTGPIFLVVKKGINLIFLKEIIKEYSSILKRQLKNNLESFGRISEKFRNLQVSIVIQDEKNKGVEITSQEAEALIAQNLLNQEADQEQIIDNVSEEFKSPNNIEYILKVEKYEETRLIARAYEKESGFIKQQTSPSYFASPEELLEEIKTILNTEL